jgi:hypothetical protein
MSCTKTFCAIPLLPMHHTNNLCSHSSKKIGKERCQDFQPTFNRLSIPKAHCVALVDSATPVQIVDELNQDFLCHSTAPQAELSEL